MDLNHIQSQTLYDKTRSVLRQISSIFWYILFLVIMFALLSLPVWFPAIVGGLSFR